MSSSLTGRVLGKYQVAEKLGSGGMADVFRGIQIGLDREVAIKVLPKPLAADREMVRRFRRESQATAKLSHPNIITIYDSGEQDGFYFYVMEFLKSDSLEDLLERERPLALARALKIGQDVLKALAYCHEKEILHRDLKPANIKFDLRDNAILTDFGLVKDLGETSITHPGQAIGTPKFMAPEQLTGADGDARTDLYGAGAILFEMVTPAVCSDAKARTAALGAVPDELFALVRRALEEDPAARYPNAREMLAELKRVELKLKAKKISRPTTPVSPPAPSATDGSAAPSVSAPSASVPSALFAGPADMASALKLLAVALPVFVLGLAGTLWALGLFPWRTDVHVIEQNVDAQAARAVINWKTDRPCLSLVEYWPTDRPDAKKRTAPPGAPGTEHRQELAPLKPGTSYSCRLLSGDSPGAEPPYVGSTFPVETRPEIMISEVHADASRTRIVLSWETTVKTDSTVRFGLRVPYSELRSNLDDKAETVHSVAVEGLTTDTSYHFQIVATEPSGRSEPKSSEDLEFRTRGHETEQKGGLEPLVRSYVDKLSRMTPDERDKLRNSIETFTDLKAALTAVDQAALLGSRTNPRHAEEFATRLKKANRWLVDLALAGKPVGELAANPAILEKMWHLNPLQAARRLDIFFKELERAGALPAGHDTRSVK